MNLKNALLLAALSLSLAACQQPAAAPPAPPAVAVAPVVAPTAVATNGLTRVTEPNKVCMVNDQFMDKEQIPVEVGGKTYFGCCPMCKDKLANNVDARMGVDPVSGARVDKSVAVLAKNGAGKMFYFESEATLSQFKN